MILGPLFAKRKISNPKKHQSLTGFTLIELLVVIAIIGLLASVVLVSLNSARQKAKVARTASELRQLNTVLNLYFNDNNGAYPCFDHNFSDAKETVWSAPYVKWPKNPWGLVYHWEHGQVGLQYSISVQGVPSSEAQALDKAIDDNDLSTGILRSNYGSEAGRLEWGGVDQSVPFIDCHI